MWLNQGTYLILLNLGGIASYLIFGYLADKIGRRITWAAGLISSVVSIALFVSIPGNSALLAFAPILGLGTYGLFGIMGAYEAELFPAETRATALTFLNASGRFFALFAPTIIGALATTKGMAFGLGSTAVIYFVTLLLVPLLPETRKSKIEGIAI